MKKLLATSIASVMFFAMGAVNAGSWAPTEMSVEQITATLDGEYNADFNQHTTTSNRVDIAVMEFRSRTYSSEEEYSKLNDYLQDTED
jgi:hypothetical protein